MKALKTHCLLFAAITLLAIAGPGTQTTRAQILNPGALVGFNPQPDPPGFGLVSLGVDQTIHLNVTCFEHPVGLLPPGPCRGQAMFHTAAGDTLVAGNYDLAPGHSTFLTFTRPVTNVDADVVVTQFGVSPIVIPAPDSGRAIPSVEVFNAAGRVMLFENPAAPKMSDFNNGLLDPGSLVGFNPQPDPPGFGLMTLRADQIVRLNVVCFAHPIGQYPPGPCRGQMMFHDAAGDVLTSDTYDLKPGEAKVLTFAAPPVDVDANAVAGVGTPQMGISPCVLPEPGGRAVPNVEIIDASTGETQLLINPATARMSGFNHNETLVLDTPAHGRDR